jgi:hypothetical protein
MRHGDKLQESAMVYDRKKNYERQNCLEQFRKNSFKLVFTTTLQEKDQDIEAKLQEQNYEP